MFGASAVQFVSSGSSLDPVSAGTTGVLGYTGLCVHSGNYPFGGGGAPEGRYAEKTNNNSEEGCVIVGKFFMEGGGCSATNWAPLGKVRPAALATPERPEAKGYAKQGSRVRFGGLVAVSVRCTTVSGGGITAQAQCQGRNRHGLAVLHEVPCTMCPMVLGKVR